MVVDLGASLSGVEIILYPGFEILILDASKGMRWGLRNFICGGSL